MIDCPILADNCFLLLDFRVLASIAFRGFKSNHQIPFFVCDCCLAIQENLVPFLPPLENPLAPEQRYMHSRVFYKYLPWHGNFEAGYLVDWLGVRTRSSFIKCHEKSLSRTTESAPHTTRKRMCPIPRRYAWDCIRDGLFSRLAVSDAVR